ncbi:hypothetical protein JCM8097_005717 [Rhodosporidiobolus ruineniae]
MSRPYSHREPSVEPDRPRTGEWDTPLHHQHNSAPTPSTSTRSRRTPRDRVEGAGQLIRASEGKPQRSQLKQEVLSEDDYLACLSSIIQRDFFPHLRSLEAQHNVLDAFESRDHERIQDSVRRMRELGRTPRAMSSRRERRDTTPGRTPYSAVPLSDATPTHFDRTPMTSASSTPGPSSSRARLPEGMRDPTQGFTLDAFQARFTSEDNSSFADLLARDNEQRREKNAWAWKAEEKANQKAIRGRAARERLVDVTRRMVEAGGGEVKMLDGPAGRPGERRLLVPDGVAGEGDRLLIRGRDEAERLLLTAGGEEELARRRAEKGKGRAVEDEAEVDERAKQYVDWDRPTVEEEEDNRPPAEEEMQVATNAWPFKNRNSLMFPPDADRVNPSSLVTMPPPSSAKPSSSSYTLSSAPKGIRYHATRLMELEKPTRTGSGASEAGSDWTEGSGSGPSRSRIGAAVAGTPYPNPASNTPRVAGFSFVDALPAPQAAQLPPQALQELMTWGTIEATPVVLRSSSSSLEGAGGAVGPFRIREADKREELAHRMAKKAKRSLAEREGKGRGLAVDARAGGMSSLHRSILDASVRSSRSPAGFSPRASSAAAGASPRPTSDSLSPAARSLLSRTKPGRALESGLGRTKAWEEDEERRRVERAKQRAREVESRDRIRRERWTPSPAPSLGFDPVLESPPRHGRYE